MWGIGKHSGKQANVASGAVKAEIWTRTGIDTTHPWVGSWFWSQVISKCESHRDSQNATTPRVLGAGYRRTLSFSVCDLFAERSERLERWSVVLTGAALVRGFRIGLLHPSRAESCPHANQFQNNMRTECCQNFETFVTTSQRNCHFLHGALIATRTVLVNAPRIASVTLKSPLID